MRVARKVVRLLRRRQARDLAADVAVEIVADAFRVGGERDRQRRELRAFWRRGELGLRRDGDGRIGGIARRFEAALGDVERCGAKRRFRLAPKEDIFVSYTKLN